MNKYIEVCYSPLLFDLHKNQHAIVVVVDVLRATSSICTAFANGVKAIIPVESKADALVYKQNGYLVAAERDGIKLEFADFGNSPFNFSPERVKNNVVVYSTTNGTKTIKKAFESKAAVIGAFSNISVLSSWLIQQNNPVIILCAGWKGKYNIEDSAFAGALTELLLESKEYTLHCDSAIAALDMWKNHKNNISALIDLCAQRERLRKNNLDDCIEYCLTFDTCNVVPIFDGEKLKNIL